MENKYLLFLLLVLSVSVILTLAPSFVRTAAEEDALSEEMALEELRALQYIGYSEEKADEDRMDEFRYKAKHLKKSDPYFEEISCYKGCDNLWMNLETHLQLVSSPIKRRVLRRVENVGDYITRLWKK